LVTLQATQTGFDMHRVLAMDMPVMSYGKTPDQIINFYREAIRRIKELPGVDGVAEGASVPWRDAGGFGPGFEFTALLSEAISPVEVSSKVLLNAFADAASWD
jgi:putative ABC transport system permease protein